MKTQTKRKVRRALGATNGEPLPVAAQRVNDLVTWRTESFKSAVAALAAANDRAERANKRAYHAEAKLCVVRAFLQRHMGVKASQMLAALLADMDAKNAKGQDATPSP